MNRLMNRFLNLSRLSETHAISGSAEFGMIFAERERERETRGVYPAGIHYMLYDVLPWLYYGWRRIFYSPVIQKCL